MKTILTEEWVQVPDKGNHISRASIVTIKIKARRVTIKGPRGEITKNFKHLPAEMKIKK